MANETTPEVYQLHVGIRQIRPMIGRRLLVRRDSTLADLHDVLQITLGGSDFHPHRSRIPGRDYGVHRGGGLGSSHGARAVRLDHFQSRPNEWSLYEDDFGEGGHHLVRVERRLALEPR